MNPDSPTHWHPKFGHVTVEQAASNGLVWVMTSEGETALVSPALLFEAPTLWSEAA